MDHQVLLFAIVLGGGGFVLPSFMYCLRVFQDSGLATLYLIKRNLLIKQLHGLALHFMFGFDISR